MLSTLTLGIPQDGLRSEKVIYLMDGKPSLSRFVMRLRISISLYG